MYHEPSTEGDTASAGEIAAREDEDECIAEGLRHDHSKERGISSAEEIAASEHEDELMDVDNVTKSFIEAMCSQVEERNVIQEMKFESIILKKLREDILSHRDTAGKFLHECFADMVDDKFFVSWLAKKLGMKSMRLREIITSYEKEKEYKPLPSLPVETQQVYNFWKEISIFSVETHNDRSKERISKMKFLNQYKHQTTLVDDDLTEETTVLKKDANKKSIYCISKNNLWQAY